MLFCKHVRLPWVINAYLLTYLLTYVNKLFSRSLTSQVRFIILAVYHKHPGNFSCPPHSPDAPQTSHSPTPLIPDGVTWRAVASERLPLVCVRSDRDSERSHVVGSTRRGVCRQLPTRPDVVVAVLRQLVGILPQLSRYQFCMSLSGANSWYLVPDASRIMPHSFDNERLNNNEPFRHIAYPHSECWLSSKKFWLK